MELNCNLNLTSDPSSSIPLTSVRTLSLVSKVHHMESLCCSAIKGYKDRPNLPDEPKFLAFLEAYPNISQSSGSTDAKHNFIIQLVHDKVSMAGDTSFPRRLPPLRHIIHLLAGNERERKGIQEILCMSRRSQERCPVAVSPATSGGGRANCACTSSPSSHTNPSPSPTIPASNRYSGPRTA